MYASSGSISLLSTNQIAPTHPLLKHRTHKQRQTNMQTHDAVAGKEFSNIELAKAQQNLEHYITD